MPFKRVSSKIKCHGLSKVRPM